MSMPVIADHPVVESMLVYYELDMIRREYHSAIVPDLPQRHHPAIRRAAEWFRQGSSSPIGAVEQIVFERAMADRGRRAVCAQFARDVDLARSIVGDLTKIAALGTTDVEAAYSNLGLQMSGPAGVVIRWSVGPVEKTAGGRMILVGSRGKAVVSMTEEESGETVWRFEAPAGEPSTDQWPEWDPTAVTMANLAAAIKDQPHQPDWVDAARAVEMAESIDRCLKKGRTVELYNETYTEAGTFKGTMTTLGCGLLIAGIGLALFAAIVQQVARMMGWDRLAELTRHWPYFLLGVLVVFLVLQFALKLAADWTKPAESTPGGTDADAPHGGPPDRP
jgi:hypothetical protein